MSSAQHSILRAISLAFSFIAMFCLCSYGFAGSSATEREFDPKASPTPAEWKHFNKMSQIQLTALWTHHEQRGLKQIGDWAWQWRMGWIRKCEIASMPHFCESILKSGLSDDAMVVRAEAALRLGNRNAKKHNEAVVTALEIAFKNPKNFRNKQPLFVCDRILEALHKIGSKKSFASARKLAAKHAQTNSYWNSLVSVDESMKNQGSSTKK